MPLVRVRILHGKKSLGVPTAPFTAEATVQVVVDRALQPIDGVALIDPIDIYKDAEEKVRTAQLSLDTLGMVTVGELISNGYGTNMVVHIKRTMDIGVGGNSSSGGGSSAATGGSTATGGDPTSLPDTLQGMMDIANAPSAHTPGCKTSTRER